MSKIAEIEEKMAKVREEMREAGADALGADLQEYWRAIPEEVTSITWEQYTDYFNDGEECCFSVYCDAQWGIVLNEEVSMDDIRYAGEDEEPSKLAKAVCPDGDAVVEGIEAFCAFIESIEDFLEEGIGDHKQVTAFRDGRVQVDDYTNHD